MNYIQRAYESYDKSNYNLKITNSYYHFKNIQNIYHRKPQYNVIRKLNIPRLKINTSPQSNKYLLTRENKIYKKMLNDIISTKIKPKLNNYYKAREEKLRDYRNQSRSIENKKLIRENSNFKKRLKNQKSMLKINEIDRDYKKNHLKMLERLTKKNTLILPSIYGINKIMKRRVSPGRSRINSSSYDYSVINGSTNSKYQRNLTLDKKSLNNSIKKV